MLTNNKELMLKAQKGKYAVSAFNINDMEILQAVVQAGEELRSPIIISTSEGAIKYAGYDYLVEMVRIAAKNSKIPLTLHLDHGKDLNIIKNCIKKGWTSVMIDASSYDLRKNIQITKKVVELCKKKRIPVEAELGRLKGKEDLVNEKFNFFTNPNEAKFFVRQTGIDSLAIAIGTAHGAFKFIGKPKLEFERLKEIRENVSIPLVLHGASEVNYHLINLANKYGAKIKNAKGIPDYEIKKAIKLGICKVNEDTDLRIAMTTAIRMYLYKHRDVIDPREYLGAGREAIVKVAKHRIEILGSKNKA